MVGEAHATAGLETSLVWASLLAPPDAPIADSTPVIPLSKGILLGNRIPYAPNVPYALATVWLLGPQHLVVVHLRLYTALR